MNRKVWGYKEILLNVLQMRTAVDIRLFENLS